MRAATDVINVSLRLHRQLGPALLESVFETVLAAKLAELGHPVERQRSIAIDFKGLHFDAAFRIDLIVGNRLLVEIKSVERLNAAHAKQLLTYLRRTKQPLGAAYQFRRGDAEGGIRRVLNGYAPFAPSREPTFWRLICSTSQA